MYYHGFAAIAGASLFFAFATLWIVKKEKGVSEYTKHLMFGKAFNKPLDYSFNNYVAKTLKSLDRE